MGCDSIKPLELSVARAVFVKAAGDDGEISSDELTSAFVPFFESKQRRLLQAALCDPELKGQVRFAEDAQAAVATILGTGDAPPPAPASEPPLAAKLLTAAKQLTDPRGNAMEAQRVYFPSLDQMGQVKQGIAALSAEEHSAIQTELTEALWDNLARDLPLRAAITLQCLCVLGGTPFNAVADAFTTVSRSSCGFCRAEAASAICLFAGTDPAAVRQFLDEWIGRESDTIIASQLKARADCIE